MRKISVLLLLMLCLFFYGCGKKNEEPVDDEPTTVDTEVDDITESILTIDNISYNITAKEGTTIGSDSTDKMLYIYQDDAQFIFTILLHGERNIGAPFGNKSVKAKGGRYITVEGDYSIFWKKLSDDYIAVCASDILSGKELSKLCPKIK